MGGAHANLYVEAHGLALWLAHTFADADERPESLEVDLCRLGREFLYETGEALSFPARRTAALQRADLTLARVRVGLELAAALGRVSSRQVRHAAERIDRAGRMLGGWQKARRRSRAPTPEQGTSPEVPTA